MITTEGRAREVVPGEIPPGSSSTPCVQQIVRMLLDFPTEEGEGWGRKRAPPCSRFNCLHLELSLQSGTFKKIVHLSKCIKTCQWSKANCLLECMVGGWKERGQTQKTFKVWRFYQLNLDFASTRWLEVCGYTFIRHDFIWGRENNPWENTPNKHDPVATEMSGWVAAEVGSFFSPSFSLQGGHTS